MKRLLIYLIIPLQIFVLLLVPRFGWHIHHPDATMLNYASIYRESGYTHTIYSLDGASVDIAYKNRFSHDFFISIDGEEPYHMTVLFDGASIGEIPGTLPFTGSDIVWKDSSGMFYRLYIFALVLTLISIILHSKAIKKIKQKRIIYEVLSVISLCVSLLVSLRVIV